MCESCNGFTKSYNNYIQKASHLHIGKYKAHNKKLFWLNVNHSHFTNDKNDF